MVIKLDGIDHDVWIEKVLFEDEELLQITIWNNDPNAELPCELFRFDADQLARRVLGDVPDETYDFQDVPY